MLMAYPGSLRKRLAHHFTLVNDLPVTARDIADATKKDPVLSKILQLVKCGWPR